MLFPVRSQPAVGAAAAHSRPSQPAAGKAPTGRQHVLHNAGSSDAFSTGDSVGDSGKVEELSIQVCTAMICSAK
jgi:hypothetical protein